MTYRTTLRALGRSLGGWLVLLAPACARPSDLSWTVTFDPPALRSQAAVAHAEIRMGGCGGPTFYVADVRPGATMSVPTPPLLARGRWGFVAEARDASCMRVAMSDCVELDLPGPRSVTLRLVSTAVVPACPGLECRSGACGGTSGDGGSADGGGADADAGPCVAPIVPQPTEPGCTAATRTCLGNIVAGGDAGAMQTACLNADADPAGCRYCLNQDLYFSCTTQGGCGDEYDLLYCCARSVCPTLEAACTTAAGSPGGACETEWTALGTCFANGQSTDLCGVSGVCFPP